MTRPPVPATEAPATEAGQNLNYATARGRSRPYQADIVAIEQEARAAQQDRVAAARFVAEHWRDSYMRFVREGQREFGIGTHVLALTLAALDGETDPRQLGLPVEVHDAFRALLTSEAPARETAEPA